MNWLKDLRGKVKLCEPLKRHTTFRIGGAAKYFVEPCDAHELQLLLKLSKRHKAPIRVLGAGSNILVSDRGTKAMILRLNSPAFKKITLHHNHAEVGSGVMLRNLIVFAEMQGLSGLEFLAGIPGTLGGALMMNAGAWGRSIADLVQQVNVMDYHGNIKTLKNKDIKFGYRTTNLGRFIILDACLKLIRKNKKQIKDKIEGYLKLRRESQDLSRPSAGCIFKNPKNKSAGALIDKCGLKGARCGDAIISHKHANFILNRGKAKASDVLKLMNLARKKVKASFNVILEPEIKIWN